MADEGRSDLVSTTDCLEAVSVLKAWKNFFFFMILACLVVLQVSFWVVDSNLVEPNSVPAQQKQDGSGFATTAQAGLINLAATLELGAGVNMPAPEAADVNVPAKRRGIEINQVLRFEHIAWVIRVFNFVLILSLLMYCLSILFAVKVSLVGRLGGINHILRAFFLSLVILVLALPWQNVFGSVVTGWIFTPLQILASKANADKDHTVIMLALYYLRFAGLWVLILGLAILAQLRTNRWSKATMRRLGVL